MRPFAAILLLCFPALAQNPVEVGPAKDQEALAVEKEVALGRDLAEQDARQFKPFEDLEKTAYVNSLAQKLAAPAALPYPVSVRVVDNWKPFASAYPGGYLLVSSRLLSETTEPELAGILAHMLAHIKQGRDKFTQARANASVPLVFMGGSCIRFQNVTAIPVPVNFRSQLQDAEPEADRLALEYLHQAGYAAQPLPEIFDRLRAVKRPENWNPPTLRRPGEQR